MQINKKELQQALRIVKPGLGDENTNIEQATSFAFIGEYVVTYNDQISIKHPVENLDLTGAIKASELYQLLEKVKKDELNLEIDRNELTIKAGRMKSVFTINSEITLPLLEAKFRWKKLPEDFCESINFAAPVCSNDFSKIVLTCLNITKEGIIEASDSYRIIRKELISPMPGEILLPASVVKYIHQLNPIKVSFSKGWVHFATEMGTIISCRIVDGEFPDVTKHFIEKGRKVSFPKRILDIIDKARIFSKKDFVLDEEVTITLNDNKLIVQSSSDTGKFRESAKMKYNGDKIEFQITPVLFEHILKQTQTFILGKDRVQFSGENWQYLVLLKNVK